MENIQRIIVEIDSESPFEYIIAKQGEANSRIVEVELIEKSVPYIIPAGTKAMIKYRKPDGKKVLNDCIYSGNIVTVTYTEQMLSSSGTGKGEIMLVNGTEIIKSATFYTKVVETVYKENGLISDNEFLSLAGALIKTNQTLEKIDNAVTGAEQALQEAGEMKESCEVATEKADQAAEDCNAASTNMQQECSEALGRVNIAVSEAEEATGNANKATEDCNAASANMQQECNEALGRVNIAVSEAEEATGNANKATEDCNAASANMQQECNEALDKVNTAVSEAEKATGNANQAAQDCNDIIDGLTPRIGDDGNWYVGKEDTGVKANGGITVYDGFDSESTTNAAAARTVKVLKTSLDSHTHTKSQITDFPASMKNPNPLTISLNGTSQGAYDGSAAKTINVTPSNIGAAASSHTHNYAGSSSAGGAANSAVKLQTARRIMIGAEAHTFNGSADITFSAENMGFTPAKMGLLKIVQLTVKQGTFAQIKCKVYHNNSGSSFSNTPKYFFMIINCAPIQMGGYYISSTTISSAGVAIGGSGAAIRMTSSLTEAGASGNYDDSFTLTGFSGGGGPCFVIYDAANVTVKQL